MFLLPWVLNKCYAYNLFDKVNERKLHRNNIPRLGGVVFLPILSAVLLITFFMMYLLDGDTTLIHFSNVIIALGCSLLFVLGVVDDILEVPAIIKLLVQFGIACLFPFCSLYINNLYGFCGIYELPIWVSYILTVFTVVLIINAINLIDGIDGLAASLTALSFLIFGYYFYNIGLEYLCVVIATLVGILIVYFFYNMFGSVETRTKTFMGDSGSLFLGVMLAYLAIKCSMDTVFLPYRPNSLMLAFTLVLVPCFDLCRVALCRMMRGKSIFSPDKTHIHHKLMSKGLAMHPTLFAIIALYLFLCVLNMSLDSYNVGFTVIAFIDLVILTLLNIWLPINEVEQQSPNDDHNNDKIVYNETDPLISIVTATFNSATTLRDTFESILHQSYKKYEVIVIDGASKDNTMEIVKEYQQKFQGKLKYMSEPDRGIYEGMNKGFNLATGDVVGILNSDDFYTSGNVLQNIAAELKNGHVDAVYGDVHYVSAENLAKVTRYYSSRIFSRSLMRLGFMPAHPSFYCRRNIIMQKGMFNTQYRVAADFDQLLRLLYVEKIKTQYMHLDFVTMREGGASNNSLASRMTIMNEHRQILRSNSLHTNTILLLLRYIYKAMEVIVSPYLSYPKLPSYITKK